ncbi:MAG: aldose 1-epimerase [Halanaerobiaceae bacterium]|nr:aldose 1-epimerase [Halanaerobiaceae bacterium]
METLLYLKNEFIELAVSPEVGGSIYSLRYKKDGEWLDIMRPTTEEALQDEDAGSFASYNLFPYSNRIENARLKFKGREYQLEVNFDDGHAIHGEAWLKPWKVVEAEEDRLLLEFNSKDFADISWPFPFQARIEYAVKDKDFIVKTFIKNESNELMPAGMGIHPYFMRDLKNDGENPVLKMETMGVYPGETQIPAGRWVEAPEKWNFTPGRELPVEFVDHCFRVGEGPIEISWEKSNVKLTMERDAVFKHIVLYCPVGERFFALEPVTNCNNGFNMAEEGIEDTGTIELEPGEEIRGEIYFRFE